MQPDDRRIKFNSLYFSLFILFIALLFRFKGLSQNSIWLDESWMFVGLFEDHSGFLKLYSIGGIYNNLMFCFSKVVDLYSEYNLRFLSVILGGLSSLIIFRISRQFTDEIFALCAGICVSVSPLLIVYSQDYSPYIFGSFFMILQYYFFIKWTEQYSYIYSILFGIAGLIGVNTRPQQIFFLFGLIISSLIYKPFVTKKKIKSIFVALSILSFSIITIYITIIFANDMGSRSSHVVDYNLLLKLFDLVMTSLFNLPNKMSTYSPVSSIVFYYKNAVFFRLFFIISFFIALIYFVKLKNKYMISLSAGINIFVIFSSIGILESNQFFERYLLMIQPLLIIFIVNFLYQISRGFYIKKIFVFGFLILLISFWTHLTFNSSYNVRWKPTNREAFQKIMENSFKDRSSYCVVPYFYEWATAKYYLKNSTNVQLIDKSFDFFKELKQSLQFKNDDYKKFALKQIRNLKESGAEQIFIYTRRGKFLVPFIKDELVSSYNENIIYDYGTIVVYQFLLKD